MKYCSSCGNQIDSNAAFCPNCGAAQTPQSPAPQAVAAGGKRLHCPKCKGIQIIPIVETDVKNGFSVNTAASKHIGFSNTYLKSMHRDYWMCQSCGHKFRQLENLEAEVNTVRKSMKPSLIFCIVFAVLSLLCLITEVGFACFLSVPFSLLMGILYIYYNNQYKKLTAEKEYLSIHCFD